MCSPLWFLSCILQCCWVCQCRAALHTYQHGGSAANNPPSRNSVKKEDLQGRIHTEQNKNTWRMWCSGYSRKHDSVYRGNAGISVYKDHLISAVRCDDRHDMRFSVSFCDPVLQWHALCQDTLTCIIRMRISECQEIWIDNINPHDTMPNN